MAALRTRRRWWAKRDGHVFADAPLFRALARRWKPVAKVRSEPLPLPLAAAATEEQPVSRAWLARKPRFIVTEPEKPRPAWSPWLWVK